MSQNKDFSVDKSTVRLSSSTTRENIEVFSTKKKQRIIQKVNLQDRVQSIFNYTDLKNVMINQKWKVTDLTNLDICIHIS